jgi:hypothetical protein
MHVWTCHSNSTWILVIPLLFGFIICFCDRQETVHPDLHNTEQYYKNQYQTEHQKLQCPGIYQIPNTILYILKVLTILPNVIYQLQLFVLTEK